MGNLGKYLKGDKVIWLLLFFFALISLLGVYSSSGVTIKGDYEIKTALTLFRRGAFILIGLFVILVTHRIPHQYFSKISVGLYYISILLLFFTLMFGEEINGAKRWLDIFGLITIQPSDVAKLALMMYLARVVSIIHNLEFDLKTAFRQLIVPVIIVVGLIVKEDNSTGMMLFAAVLLLLLVSTIHYKYILSLFTVAAVAFTFYFLAASAIPGIGGRTDTLQNRLGDFFSPEESYQELQARMSIVSGGLFIKGPSQNPQAKKIPDANSDYIYAFIIGEYGLLLGGIIVPLLFLILFYRVMLLIRKCKGSFSAFLLSGLIILISLQAFIHMLVSVGLVPVTGVPLPMISKGGSSLLITCLALGVILSVSRDIEEREKAISDEEEGSDLSLEKN